MHFTEKEFLIKSHKGQQGCLDIMSLFCPVKKESERVVSRVEGIGDVGIVADSAADFVDGGDHECVLKALKGEIAIGRAFVRLG